MLSIANLQAENGSCASGKLKCHLIDLKPYNEIVKLDQSQENIFFIESTGRDHLTPRQACSVESALRNSNISSTIVGEHLKNP